MQINNYPVEQGTMNDLDWLDIDASLGGGNYESRKVSWATLKNEIGAVNIGNSDLTITDTGFRDLKLGGALSTDGFRFLDTGDSPLFEVLGNGATGINKGNPTSLVDIQLKGATKNVTDNNNLRVGYVNGGVLLGSDNGNVGIVQGYGGANTGELRLNPFGGGINMSNNTVLFSESSGINIAMSNTSSGGFKHNIRSRHNNVAHAGNDIDFYLWDYINDGFSENGSKHGLTISAEARVGIGGITSPDASLHISSSNVIGLQIDGGDIKMPSGNLGFSGTGAYTNFTIENGIITAAS